MLHPFGFFRFPLKISLYRFMLLLLMASSKVIVIIIGTFLGGKSPGTVVPSSEQKQSGRTHTAGSQCGARFGSLSISAIYWRKKLWVSASKINLHEKKAFWSRNKLATKSSQSEQTKLQVSFSSEKSFFIELRWKFRHLQRKSPESGENNLWHTTQHR